MRGVWTALVTPFNSAREVDLEAFRRLVRRQIEAGVDGVIPCGTTGESPTLTLAEKKALIQASLEEAGGTSVRVIAGTGSNSTAETVELSRWASGQGVAGVLVVAPYYNKPSQAGLEGHFRAVAEAVTVDVMLYNVPGRSAVSIAPETVVRLAAHPKIRSIKEASGSVTTTSEILDLLSQSKHSMSVLCGDDALFLPCLAVGATGVVSVASNVVPSRMTAIQRAADRKDFVEAGKLHRDLYPLFRDLFVESNPGPVKAALEQLGLCSGEMRLPMAPLAAENLERLKTALGRCGVRKGGVA